MRKNQPCNEPLWLSFFFSSRRRHTRCLSDWSSDVCSSDLGVPVRSLCDWTAKGIRRAIRGSRGGDTVFTPVDLVPQYIQQFVDQISVLGVWRRHDSTFAMYDLLE